MNLGIYLRNMGPQATRSHLLRAARDAEAADIDELWVVDHIAIPPDDAEGSEGWYVDPLATLAFFAGATERIRLGVGVLVLPYRPPLPTAKWVASVQELAGGRLALGVGAGWMPAEFKALGVDRSQRGKITDTTLGFLHRCFAGDEVEENDQRFLFKPRPTRPPFIIGGGPEAAFKRCVRFGDGWMPFVNDPAKLAGPVDELRKRMEDAGKAPPEIVGICPFDPAKPDETTARLEKSKRAGVTSALLAWRYTDDAGYKRGVEAIAGTIRPALDSA